MDDLEERLDVLLREHLGALAPDGPIEADQDLQSLGLDSMTTVQLLLEIEETFDVVLPDDALTDETFGTPGRLSKAIREASEAEANGDEAPPV